MLYKRPFFIIRFLFMKHIIDIDTWERRDNYGFFRTFLNSWYSVTTEIDCTEASAAAKQSGHSFFLYYLYAVLRSANEVDELRYRTDKNGQVVFHDRVDIISPIAVPGKTFYTVRIPYHEDFKHFYAEAYYNPQIQISAESGTKRSIFRQKNKTKRSKKRLHTTLIKPEQKVNEDLCSGFIVS